MAGNHKATGKKAAKGPELIQRSRAAILEALDLLEAKGKSIGELLLADLEASPSRFMELASKFCPKDITAEITHTLSASDLTDDELADIAATRSKGAAKSENRTQKLH